MEVEYTANTPKQLKESKVSFHGGLFCHFTLLKPQSFYLNAKKTFCFSISTLFNS